MDRAGRIYHNADIDELDNDAVAILTRRARARNDHSLLTEIAARAASHDTLFQLGDTYRDDPDIRSALLANIHVPDTTYEQLLERCSAGELAAAAAGATSTTRCTDILARAEAAHTNGTATHDELVAAAAAAATNLYANRDVLTRAATHPETWPKLVNAYQGGRHLGELLDAATNPDAFLAAIVEHRRNAIDAPTLSRYIARHGGPDRIADRIARGDHALSELLHDAVERSTITDTLADQLDAPAAAAARNGDARLAERLAHARRNAPLPAHIERPAASAAPADIAAQLRAATDDSHISDLIDQLTRHTPDTPGLAAAFDAGLANPAVTGHNLTDLVAFDARSRVDGVGATVATLPLERAAAIAASVPQLLSNPTAAARHSRPKLLATIRTLGLWGQPIDDAVLALDGLTADELRHVTATALDTVDGDGDNGLLTLLDALLESNDEHWQIFEGLLDTANDDVSVGELIELTELTSTEVSSTN